MDLLLHFESDRDLIKARERYIALTRQPGQLVALADKVPASASAPLTFAEKADLAAIRLWFNNLELLAIGLQAGSLEYGIVKRFSKTQVLQDWSNIAPLAFVLRKKLGQDAMYHELEELARWLKEKKMPRRRRLLSLWW